MIEVRPANTDDVVATAELLEELDRFYGDTEVEPLGQRVAGITAALFEEPVAAFVLLAWDGHELIGLASYSFLWPAAGVTRSLYLKELYVKQGKQRQGVGKLLMHEIQQVAAKHRCSRVEWTADVENKSAHSFYAALGARRHEGKVFYRVDERSGAPEVGRT